MNITPRKVYQHLPERCFRIIPDFWIELIDILKDDLTLLVNVIDYADQIIDDYCNKYNLNSEKLLLYLGDGNIQTIEILPTHVINLFKEFRNRLIQKNILQKYIKISHQITSARETTKWAYTIDSFLISSKEEWRKTGQMTVLFLQEYTTYQLEKFFIEWNILGRLVDDLHDLDDDIKNWMRRISPSHKLIRKMKWYIANQIKICFMLYPKKAKAIKEVVKYILKMNKIYKWWD